MKKNITSSLDKGKQAVSGFFKDCTNKTREFFSDCYSKVSTYLGEQKKKAASYLTKTFPKVNGFFSNFSSNLKSNFASSSIGDILDTTAQFISGKLGCSLKT